MNKSILILGASGFIGRSLSHELASGGWTVYACTRRPENFTDPKIINIVSPFNKVEHFKPWVTRSNVIIHAASHTTPSSSAALPQLDGNLLTTLALIEALQEAPKCKVVFLSSGGAIYGNTNKPAIEKSPLNPCSYHAAGKIAAEYFLQAWANQYSGDLTILRPSNIYGPGQLSKPGFGIIPAAFKSVLDNKQFCILGDGESVRDYLYIDDFTKLCKLICETSSTKEIKIFNAASGTAQSLNNLLDTIDLVTKTPLTRSYMPSRIFDIQKVLINNDEVMLNFDWKPTTSIKEGLTATWKWWIQ